MKRTTKRNEIKCDGANKNDAPDKQLKIVTFSTWFEKSKNRATAAGAGHFGVNAIASEESADLVDLGMADAEGDQ